MTGSAEKTINYYSEYSSAHNTKKAPTHPRINNLGTNALVTAFLRPLNIVFVLGACGNQKRIEMN
jgi:hypothetical protein